MRPYTSWKYDAIGKPLWSKAEGFITLTPVDDEHTQIDFIERYWTFNPWMRRLGLERGSTTSCRATTTCGSAR